MEQKDPSKKIIIIENGHERETTANMLVMFEHDTEHQLLKVSEDDTTIKYKVLQKLNG